MPFTSSLTMQQTIALITLAGELDAAAAPLFRADVEKAAETHPEKLVLLMQDLSYMASAGLRALIFAKQKMGPNTEIIVVGVQEPVWETIQLTGFNNSITTADKWTA